MIDVKKIKKYILENDCSKAILEDLGCHNIHVHSGHDNEYYTFSNPDGDNPNAVTLYLNEQLKVINYTREISKSDLPTDIFTLIEFYKDINFFQSVKYVCDLIDVKFYDEEDEDIFESLKILRMISSMKSKGKTDDDNTPIKPLSKEIAKYYPPIGNIMFYKDGIDYQTQYEFGLSYDNESNRILIPIHSEIGDLVSYKGRLFKDKLDKEDQKYLYLYPCPRNKLLFGYHKTYPYIKKEGWVWVFESEKAPMQLWSHGYYNSIATGGTKIGQSQIEKMSRLGVPICFCFDKDIDKSTIEGIADRFINGIDIYAIFDEDNLLGEKESPSDNIKNWKKLIKNNVYKIR